MPSAANNTASTSPNIMSRTNSPRPGAGVGAGSRQYARHQMATPARRANVGSATQTITPPDSASDRSISPDPLVLRLRGAHDASATPSTRPGHRRRITWAEDVIDNEGLGRKSSKVCCIYHKPREFGESSSEDDSSSSDSDGSDTPDDGGARMVGGNRRGRTHHPHGHKHSEDCGNGKGKGKRKPSPNAYEKMPKYQGKQQTVKR
ncbi:hypothetical protein PV11_06040 [Exophiala sideris]|uniref:Type 1 phosphatases regulator n=1 Tax=Exophiala sideris TaxID=1016849 RepID=A0A0D1X8D7_9EURO|nr:hypothetical protein PV11_06040 [Exophiala sideris]